MLIVRFLIAIVVAFFAGKLISKIKMPAILGWLLVGMILGPHALGVMNGELLETSWYLVFLNIFEVVVGLMIGTELVWDDLKRMGKQIIVTTMFQSLTTFGIVALFFGTIFYFMNIPIYLSIIFGGIALATAPAPALSVVKEFKTDGPVTRTLIPIAALDDIVAIIVFFSITSIITATYTADSAPLFMTLALMIGLPIVIGIIVGLFAGIVLKKETSKGVTIASLSALILLVSTVGYIFNHHILAEPSMNFLLIGMAFSATFANIVSKDRLMKIMSYFSPFLAFALLVVILNLGAPLDYNLILGAGLFTAIYILSRALGKYSGAYFGAKMTGMSKTVQKYLGLTLLPHSGVSLVFTGIAASSIRSFDPESAIILQGTIAAAAIINEIFAVIMAKKAFEWAGEFGKRK